MYDDVTRLVSPYASSSSEQDMTEIKLDGDRPVIDYTGRDYDGVLRALRERIPGKLPEWTDFQNEADFGNVMLELFAYTADILSYYQDRVANESFLSTAVTRRSVISHLKLIGYRMRTAAPAAATLRITIPASAAVPKEPLTIERGAAFATKSLENKPSIRFEYTGLPMSLEFKPVEDKNADGPKFVDVQVQEGRVIQNDIIGTSNNLADQRYTLTHRGLIMPPTGPESTATPDITVVSTLTGSSQHWTYRDSLAFSKSGDHDFTVDIDENDVATLTFGDGKFGAIPPDDATITATYRVGGGRAGNVGANSIVSIVDSPRLAALGATVTNPPAVYRSRHRAVTTDDYEVLARSYDGVAKVRATAAGWNRVTLNVAPAGGGIVTDTLELGLKRYLEDKRMLTQIVEVEKVDYVEIFVTAEIGIESYYAREDVIAAAKSAADALLAFDEVDFGETLYLSRFYDAIQSTAGVRFANIIEFKQTGQKDEVESRGQINLLENQIPIPPSDTLYSSGIQVIARDE
jgi:baseplate J-like protein